MIYILQHKDKNCTISFSARSTTEETEGGLYRGVYIKYTNALPENINDNHWNYHTLSYARAV